MSGPYPLATLGPTITSTGISIPAYSDIYASLQASFQAIYGADAYISPDGQDGQWIAILAKGYADQNNSIVALYNSFSPSFAQGAELSSLVRINGLTRLIATNSTAVGNVVGNAGTVVSNGIVKDSNGNLWNLPPSVTIPLSGTVAVTVTAQNVGSIIALAGTINQIYTPQLGWASFVSTSDATTGAPVESDAALRIRQALSVALPATSPLQSITAAIAAISGVTRSTVYENNTATTDANGVPSHTISVIVQGGDINVVAQTIEQTKSLGTGTFGTTNVTVTDPSGLPIVINFFELALTDIYVSVTVKALPTWSGSTATAIQNAVSAFINSLPIGGEVYNSQLYPAAQLDSASGGLTYYITSLYNGTAPSPGAPTNIPIAFNAAANCLPAHVTVTVT